MRTQWKQTALATALHVSLCVFALPLVAAAQQGPAVQTWTVEAGSLQQAISRVMRQGRLTISYPSDLVAGKTTPGLSGTHTPREALERLLEGSGIKVEAINETSFVLRQAGEESLPEAVSPSGLGSKRATLPAAAGQVTGVEEPIDISPVVVTGTRIRGGTTPSPVITIGSERIREEGFSNLGEVIRAMPQNFSGGQNPGVTTALGSGNLYNQNATGGSSLNLRGMGADATLTLLNGRRMAYGGFGQAIDISAIPVEAVERIEVVTDGASAIYGSDAVAGVGNVILKRDFEGFALSARHGNATDGGLATREYSATAGVVWSSGALLATYRDVTVDPIFADQRDYTDAMGDPYTIYPGSTLRGGLVSAYQNLGDRVEVRIDALRTKRDQQGYQRYPAFYYDSRRVTTTSFVAPSVEIALPGDWSLLMGGAWGKDENVNRSLTVTVATGISTLSSRLCYCNESRSYDVGAEGPLFAMWGGDARLAVGAGRRENDFLNHNLRTGGRQAGSESSNYAYAEVDFPLIGPDANLAGAHRLSLTAAARFEDYDSFGGVSTPKLGVVYGPSADITLKASWGRSFKAPLLSEHYGNRYAYLYPASTLGGVGYASDATVLLAWGSNPDLAPERARTTTASLAFHPEALPGLEAELTWFHVNYGDRVVQPLTAITQAMSNPALDEFFDYSPTPEEQADLLATYSYTFLNQTGAPYDPSRVVAIAWGQFANAMRQRIRGVDLSGSYRFDVGDGALTLRGSASWLDSSQQNSAGQGPFDLAGVIFYPAKVSARFGSVWTDGGLSASAFVNYIGGVTDHIQRKKGASFTTFDATLRYAVGAERAAWSGWEFAFAAQNLFDRAPPLYAPAAITDVPYDSTNYTAIGRFLSFSVSKNW